MPVRPINGRDLLAQLGNYRKCGDNLTTQVSAATLTLTHWEQAVGGPPVSKPSAEA